MSRTIEAIFENGVFRPLEKIDIKEHEKVEIRVFSTDEWQNRFNHLIKKIQKKASQHTTEEIEADITQAIFDFRR